MEDHKPFKAKEISFRHQTIELLKRDLHKSWKFVSMCLPCGHFQINWLTLLFSLSGCPNLDIWKWLLAFFLFLFFSHMHQCHWYEDPTINLASCNFRENTWKVIFGIYLWLLNDGMDEQNIGEKSFFMKLHILVNVDYATLNSCILDLNFFLDISHLYWGLGKFFSMPSSWTKSPYI